MRNLLFSVQGIILGSNGYVQNYSNIFFKDRRDWSEGIFTQKYRNKTPQELKELGVDTIPFNALPKHMQRRLSESLEPIENECKLGEKVHFSFDGLIMRLKA